MITFPRCYAGLDLELPPDRTPANNGEHEPALPDKAVFASTEWLGAITRLSMEIFQLSQKPGMPDNAREAMDDAREELHRAKVNINFALHGS